MGGRPKLPSMNSLTSLGKAFHSDRFPLSFLIRVHWKMRAYLNHGGLGMTAFVAFFGLSCSHDLGVVNVLDGQRYDWFLLPI